MHAGLVPLSLLGAAFLGLSWGVWSIGGLLFAVFGLFSCSLPPSLGFEALHHGVSPDAQCCV